MVRTPEAELDDAVTPDDEELVAGLALVDALVVGDDTYSDEGGDGGLAFADAPLDDETPIDDLVGLAAGGAPDGIDVGDEPADDATTVPPSVDGLDVGDDDTPADGAPAADGLDEQITLPPELDDAPPGD